MSKYTINVSFQTRVNKTTRTLEIAESFGLGLDKKEWTLYDNLELEVKQGDVVYITGQSGSGKSVVLRELQRQMKDEGLSVSALNMLSLLPFNIHVVPVVMLVLLVPLLLDDWGQCTEVARRVRLSRGTCLHGLKSVQFMVRGCKYLPTKYN
ncbi:putative ATP-binding component of an ABC superfamily transporter [Buttiauxella gaviniae ATCC 51604]|uniref:Putative ATP-binding component of an ABC superfamily transporter n=1 Tax=Buttiauxella gaviniae ATCC 51604 TaxID=1354253 RepID=A0A1B7I6W9_9ENTR|nr:putative ATP-binding component of an ABC superfamily transporter [Buttiauxella gaviniae ATCC 51604]